MNEDLVYVIAMILFGLFVLLAIFRIAIGFSNWECSSKWTSFPNRYGVMKGCQIEVNGKWIPADSYYFKQE